MLHLRYMYILVSIQSCPSLDSRALHGQLQVVLHPHSNLHHRHHPPWLGITSTIPPQTPPFWQEICSTKVDQLSACGIFLLYQARALMVGPYADSPKLSYNTSLSYTTDTILGIGSLITTVTTVTTVTI